MRCASKAHSPRRQPPPCDTWPGWQSRRWPFERNPKESALPERHSLLCFLRGCWRQAHKKRISTGLSNSLPMRSRMACRQHAAAFYALAPFSSSSLCKHQQTRKVLQEAEPACASNQRLNEHKARNLPCRHCLRLLLKCAALSVQTLHEGRRLCPILPVYAIFHRQHA